MVMDGGRVFEKHREFGASATGVVTTQRIFDKENGTTSYSDQQPMFPELLAQWELENL